MSHQFPAPPLVPHSHKYLGLALGLFAVAVFGGSLPATRLAVHGLDPWFVTSARAAIGGIVAVAILSVGRPRFPRERIGTLAVISLCLVIGFPAAMAIASVTVPSAHGGVVMGLMPLATAAAAVLLAGERPSPAFWALSAAGAGLVVTFALREGNAEVAAGDVCLGLAIAFTGVGYTLSALMSRAIPGWQVIGWALLLSLPPAAVACFVLWPADAAAVPWPAWAGLLYGGIMSQFIGYAAWNAALALGSVARVGQLQLLQPFFTFAISALVLDERIDATMIAFAVAVVVVVALGRRAVVGQRRSG
jgi:drug/metabolite transporter (DMT)-like permease